MRKLDLAALAATARAGKLRVPAIGGIAVAAVLSATLAGYRLGAGAWPSFLSTPSQQRPVTTTVTATSERKVLYWKDPDSGTDYSPTPKKTAAGRDYIAVYDDQEPDIAGAPTKTGEAAKSGSRKVLYYRNPMGLPDTSPVPKKDWMGMDYIAVREGEDDGGSTVKVSLDKVQRSGVRTEPAAMRRLVRPIRAPGVAKPDERTLLTVTLRADAFVEKLYVNETGRHVKAGEPLMRVYSPNLFRALIDYQRETGQSVIAAEQKLEVLQVPKEVIAQARKSDKVLSSFDFPSPTSGVVMQKMAIEGMMMKMGDPYFKLADLASIWVIVDVSEQDMAQVRVGAKANVSFRAFPNETFTGSVTFILNELEMATRTAKVRVQLANPDYRIKYEMFADVNINSGDGDPERIAVPLSALIDSGNRQVVIVDRGEGRFEPRPVKVGLRGDGYVEIADGIKAGENVVVAANFLIDAESNLKAALSSFTADRPKDGAQPAAMPLMEKKP